MTKSGRISLYVHRLTHTGVVINTLLASEALRDAGHDVEIVTALPGGEVPAGVRHVSLLERSSRLRRLNHFRAAPALRSHVRKNRREIAISMGNHSHSTAWMALRGMHDIRTVFRISNDLQRTASGAPRDSVPTRLIRRQFTRKLIRDCDRLVLISDIFLEDPDFGAAFADGRAEIISNGIDVEAARARAREPLEARLSLPSDVPLILAIGRLSRQKNMETLVDAFAQLVRQRAAHLVIIGQGADGARKALVARARSLGIADQVSLPGTTNNVFAWLSRASVFALPSWWEGFPMVLLEAMAVGTPVVASRTAGAAASVVGDRYGLIVDPNSAPQMAEALLRQLDPATRIGPEDRAFGFDVSATKRGWQRLARDLLDS